MSNPYPTPEEAVLTTDLLAVPVDDATTRRQFLGLLAAAGLLTACGQDSGPVGAAEAVTRSIEHTAGTTEVPVSPQRVVALDNTLTVGLLALGLTPVAAVNNVDVFLDDVGELLPRQVQIPDTAGDGNGEISLEGIAGVMPDLVLGTDFIAESYEQLARLTSTVLIERGSNGGWRQRFLALADAVNRHEQGAEVEAAYERVLAGLPEAVRRTPVAFVRADPDGQYRIDGGTAGFAGSVAADAGITALSAPAGVGDLDERSGFVTVSGEQLDLLGDAGLIVVPDFRSLGNEQDGVTAFAANPLWAGLTAVRAGRVLQLPGLVYNGGSHYAAELLLRGVADALA